MFVRGGKPSRAGPARTSAASGWPAPWRAHMSAFIAAPRRTMAALVAPFFRQLGRGLVPHLVTPRVRCAPLPGLPGACPRRMRFERPLPVTVQNRNPR